MSEYAVCAMTHKTRAMMRLSLIYADRDPARDELVLMNRTYALSPLAKNYRLVLAERIKGYWRAVDENAEDDGPLTPEEIAIIAREEAAYQEAHR